MKLKSYLVTKLIMVAVMCLPTVLLFAQGDPGGDPDPNPPNGDVPFDGGVTLLIAAGIGYAAKKAYDKRKRKETAAKEPAE